MNSHIALQLASARDAELRRRAAVHRHQLQVAPGRLARTWSRIRVSRERRRTAAGEVAYLTGSTRRLSDGAWLHVHHGS